MFKRNASPALINKLNKEPLFVSKLKNDCKKQGVFPAIRDEFIDFYYKGGRLFEYTSKEGFKTHRKYAAVIDSGSDYMTQQQLQQPLPGPDFVKHYDQIRENCARYSGVEAQGVAEIYHRHSYLKSSDNVVVLDIEAAFAAMKTPGQKTKTDRIDIVVYNKEKRKLYFVEAKHFSNPEIWSETKPEVVGQIKKYEKQVLKKKNQILQEYEKYIDAINVIFNTKLPKPKEVDEKVILLVFGFDRFQQKKLINEDYKAQLKDIRFYRTGNPKSINMENLISRAKVLP